MNAKTIRVNRSIFVVTGTYNDMMLRPYNTNFHSGTMVDSFLEHTNGARAITPDTMAPVAGQFLKPQADVLGTATIENGWGEHRLRFIIHLTIHEPNTSGGESVTHKMLQGYTDHVGVDHHGNMNPDMRLYFNGVMTYRERHIATPHGQQVMPGWISKEHIVTGTPRQAPGQPYQTTRLMRPRDVFASMGVINALEMGVMDAQPMYGMSGGGSFSGQFMDQATPFVSGPAIKADRSYGRAPCFVNSIFNAWQEAERDIEEDGFGVTDPNSHNSVYTAAQGKVRTDETYENDPYLGILNVESSFSEGGSLTFGELRKISPEIDHEQVTSVHFKRDVQRMAPQHQQSPFPDMAQRGDTEHWGGKNNETLWATILSNSVPSLMLDCFLTKISFTITNQTLDGQPMSTLLHLNTLMGGNSPDLEMHGRHFLGRMETEILRSLSRGNYIDFRITMEVDVIGDTYILLSIGGGDEVMFSTPSFSDAAFSPILAPNESYVNQMGNEFRNFFDDVNQRLMNNTSVATHNAFPSRIVGL